MQGNQVEATLYLQLRNPQKTSRVVTGYEWDRQRTEQKETWVEVEARSTWFKVNWGEGWSVVLLKYRLRVQEAGGAIPHMTSKSSMKAEVCNSSNEREKTRWSERKGPTWLHRAFSVSMGYRKPICKIHFREVGNTGTQRVMWEIRETVWPIFLCSNKNEMPQLNVCRFRAEQQAVIIPEKYFPYFYHSSSEG